MTGRTSGRVDEPPRPGGCSAAFRRRIHRPTALHEGPQPRYARQRQQFTCVIVCAPRTRPGCGAASQLNSEVSILTNSNLSATALSTRQLNLAVMKHGAIGAKNAGRTRCCVDAANTLATSSRGVGGFWVIANPLQPTARPFACQQAILFRWHADHWVPREVSTGAGHRQQQPLVIHMLRTSMRRSRRTSRPRPRSAPGCGRSSACNA